MIYPCFNGVNMNIKNGKELSYIIGLIQFDGSHSEESRNRGRITLELANRDVDILYKIKQQLYLYTEDIYIRERTRDTNFKNNSKSSILSIYDKKFRYFISKYIKPVSKENRFNPYILEDWFNKKDYLRGIYDADGSLGITSNNKPFISLCVVSESVKEYILKEIYNVLCATKNIKRNTRDNVYNIILYNEDAITFAKYLYENNTICIDRKYFKYKDMLLWVRSVPKACKRKFWDKDQDKIILDKTLTLEYKMNLLNRTKSSIKNRLYRLNKT